MVEINLKKLATMAAYFGIDRFERVSPKNKKLIKIAVVVLLEVLCVAIVKENKEQDDR